MDKLLTWNTPNGQKPAILLEELGLPYAIDMIDISDGKQQEPDFLAVNPNGKIPALITAEGEHIFESGAILTFLADREGQFLASSGAARASTLAWTFWQVGGIGPMIGQWGHFSNADGDQSYAVERFLSESIRLLEVLENQLRSHLWVAGADYSIADMMIWPWIKGGLRFLDHRAPDRLPELPAMRAWIDRVADRPAVQSALQKLSEGQPK